MRTRSYLQRLASPAPVQAGLFVVPHAGSEAPRREPAYAELAERFRQITESPSQSGAPTTDKASPDPHPAPSPLVSLPQPPERRFDSTKPVPTNPRRAEEPSRASFPDAPVSAAVLPPVLGAPATRSNPENGQPWSDPRLLHRPDPETSRRPKPSVGADGSRPERGQGAIGAQVPQRATDASQQVHVHIGTLEVRTREPTPKQAKAPAVPTGALAQPGAATASFPLRGYGLRFGLGQS